MSEHQGFADFGRSVLARAVTAPRIATCVARAVGTELEIGPTPTGLGPVAVLTAVGKVGTVTAEVLPPLPDALAFRASLPVDIEVDLGLGVKVVQHHRYRARLTLPIRVTARPVAGPALLVQMVAPLVREVQISITPRGVQAKLVGRAGNVEAQIARFAAEHLGGRLAEADDRRVDLSDWAEKAWENAMSGHAKAVSTPTPAHP